MEEQITYSTLGTCITRDIFAFCDENKIFKHIRNNGFVSPLVYSKSLPENEDTAILEKKISDLVLSNFRKRCIYLSMHGKTVDYICEGKSDYLIIDFYDVRSSILKIDDEHMITVTSHGKEANQVIRNHYAEKGFEIVTPFNIAINDIYKELDMMCDKILKNWNSSQIILLEEPIASYYANDNCIESLPHTHIDLYSGYIFYLTKLINKYFINKTKCHHIGIPIEYQKFIISDVDHKWGRCPLHYISPTYNYYFDCICKIAMEDYQSKGKELLNSIKYMYYNLLPNRFSTTTKKNGSTSSVIDKTVLNCCAIDNLQEYLEYLGQLKNCFIILTLKDTAGSWLNENIQKQLNMLGLVENLIKVWMVGYIALIKNRVVIYEKRSEKNGCEYYSDTVDYFHLNIESKPFRSGNRTKILINGTDYAVNVRGLNIVVVDLVTSRVIDSTSWDTHIPDYKLRRRTDFLRDSELARIEVEKLNRRTK